MSLVPCTMLIEYRFYLFSHQNNSDEQSNKCVLFYVREYNKHMDKQNSVCPGGKPAVDPTPFLNNLRGKYHGP